MMGRPFKEQCPRSRQLRKIREDEVAEYREEKREEERRERRYKDV
jgi:hypothetical protein